MCVREKVRGEERQRDRDTDMQRPTLAQDQTMFSVLWFVRGRPPLAAGTKGIVPRELSWPRRVDFLIASSQPPHKAGVAIPFLWVKK